MQRLIGRRLKFTPPSPLQELIECSSLILRDLFNPFASPVIAIALVGGSIANMRPIEMQAQGEAPINKQKPSCLQERSPFWEKNAALL